MITLSARVIVVTLLNEIKFKNLCGILCRPYLSMRENMKMPLDKYSALVMYNETERHPSRLQALAALNSLRHICVSKLTIIASDNDLSPGRRQAIIWTSAGILFIGPLGTNFSEILIEIITSSFKKMRLKVSFTKWRTCCLGLNVLRWSASPMCKQWRQSRQHDHLSVPML